MRATGVVREWHDDDGWGVVECDETPGGCWVHATAVRARHSFGHLPVGSEVEIDYEAGPQTPYSYRAIEAWPAGEEPYRDNVIVVEGPSEAYRSVLRISFDDEAGSARDVRRTEP